MGSEMCIRDRDQGVPEGGYAVINAIDVLARLPARIDRARDDDRDIERSPWEGL